MTKQGADLVVTRSGPLTIKNFDFETGALGIHLAEAPNTATPMMPEIDFTHPFPTTTLTFDDLINVAFLNGIAGGPGDDVILGGLGRNILFGEAEIDSLSGGNDENKLQERKVLECAA